MAPMYNVPTRTVEAYYRLSDSNGNLTEGMVPALIERVSSSGIVKGDRKNFNDWSFNVHRQYGDAYLDRQDWYQNQHIWSIGQSDFRIMTASPYSGSDPEGIDWARTHDRCLEKIFDQIRGSSNLAVDFLEAGATIKMLSNLRKLRKEVIKTVMGAKKSKKYKGLTNGQARLDFVTEKWLEGRYGWIPLLYSTYDAVQTLGKRFNGTLYPVVARSGVREESKTSSGSGSHGDPTIVTERKLSYRTEIAIQFRLPDSLQIYDWTSLNPLGIAWELAPLSFVADWFLNIGNLLSLWENYFIFANRFVRGYKTNSYSETIIRRASGTSQTSLTYPNGQVDTYIGTISFGDRTYNKSSSRVVLNGLPFPAQGVRIKPELNAKRLLDAVSLFHVFTKKTLRGVSSP